MKQITYSVIVASCMLGGCSAKAPQLNRTESGVALQDRSDTPYQDNRPWARCEDSIRGAANAEALGVAVLALVAAKAERGL